MRAPLLLFIILVPLASAAPSLSAGGWADSWCADHSPCWWYETCEYDPIEMPCTGWLSAQHFWAIEACAGENPAKLTWAAIAPDETVSAQRDLAPGECTRVEQHGTFALADCYVLVVALLPVGLGETPLHATSYDCGGSFVSMSA